MAILRNGGICLALADRRPFTGCDLIDWELLKDEHFVFGRETIVSTKANQPDQIVVDDWPEEVPITAAEVDVLDAFLGDLLDAFLRPRH